MKKYLLSIATVLLAILAASCNKELDSPYIEGERTYVPYYMKSIFTKVSYAGAEYSFKAGDKLAISCPSRDDVSGELSYNGSSEWSGEISYLTASGEPAVSTPMQATLVHADNTDQATYANGIAYETGSASSLLQAAVEKYSLFTGDFNYGDNGTSLTQQACFVEATVTFSFDGGSFNLAGETSVDVIVDGSLTVSGRAVLAQVGETKTYTTTFVIAMPGGTELTDESVIQICDRDVQMIKTGTTKTLAANNRYTVNRSIEFHPQLGDPFWSDGTYGRFAHDPGVTITGIIVFVNNYADDDHSALAEAARALTEDGSGFGHALVMSLKNAGTSVKWATSNTSNGITYITSPSEILGTSNVSGYSNTNTLIGNAANTAAKTAHDYRSTAGDTMTGTTGWFLPSIGQWVYSISTRGFGGAAPAEEWLINESYQNWLSKGQLSNLVLVKNNGTVTENLLVTSLNNRLQLLNNEFGCAYDSFGMTSGNDFADNYWSSSEAKASEAIRMNFGSVETRTDTGDKYSTIKTNSLSKTSTYAWKSAFIMKVRPFLAF
jgi:hypothetical protein